VSPLDPEIAAILEFMAAVEDEGAADLPPVMLARRGHDLETEQLSGPGDPVARVEDLEAPGPGGPVPIRLYTPAGAGGGLVVYLHGGGWAVGSIDSYDTACRALANAAGHAVASVGYRLAPEHPFPAGLDDTLAATRWAMARAGGPDRVAVAGDSAGGNLAAVAARRLRDEGMTPAFQALVYPVCDAACSTPSYREFDAGYGLSAADMRRWWNLYVDGTGALDPDASPLRAADLAGLPAAWILIAGCDVLRDEGEAYAGRLAEAGVPVQVARYEGYAHGFWRWLARCAGAREAIEEAGTALRQALGAAPAPSPARSSA
jgi:acetyl esterase